jgi:hypothetical protein
MDAFGDVSGGFRGLIKGHCPVVVVGVVIGDRIAAGRCPNKTVRTVEDIPEAKWNDLTETQKRRHFECFGENEHLRFGYARFTSNHLHSLKNHYLLHQDVSFPPAWDLALTGYAYGEILFEYDAREERRVIFEFDRVASKKQSEHVANHIEQFVPEVNPFIKGSRQSSGIQAADCFAGAVAEDHKRGTEWLDFIDSDRIVSCSPMALVQLENDLDNHD